MKRTPASASPRRVLVAGASGTLGGALCAALFARGNNLVLVARNEKRLKALERTLCTQGRTGRLEHLATDLSVPGAPEQVAQAALQQGSVDDLVFCAGPFLRTPTGVLNQASLESLFAIHVYAPLLLTQALRQSLARSKGAVVVLSDAGVLRPYTNHCAYLAAKGAIDAGMRALAIDLAPQVRVNLVRPGIVSDPEAAGPSPRSKRLAARSLTGRKGSPNDVAQVVLALLDAPWVSGQAWTVC